ISVILSVFGWLLIRFDIFNIPVFFIQSSMLYLIPDLFVTILVFWAFKLYHSVWSYASIDEIITIFTSVIVITAIQIFYKEFVLVQEMGHILWSYYFIFPMLLFA
ncbi:hypothetical protein JZU68_07725, partial [bacterium]|nr:hypothetical protein [bacterium]